MCVAWHLVTTVVTTAAMAACKAPADVRRLVLPLNQAILAGLMFLPTPQHVRLLGTGGGAIARYFFNRQQASKRLPARGCH
jgi:hypothetical protein